MTDLKDGEPQPPAEDKIKSAVAFLTHPQVATKDMSEKLRFLKHKGMTDEEIAEALKRLGLSAQATIASGRALPAQPQYSRTAQEYAMIQRQSSWWSNFALVSLVVGSLGGLVALVTRVLIPWFNERRQREEAHMRRLEEQAERSNAKLAEVTESIRIMIGELKQSIRETQTDQKHIREILEVTQQNDSEVQRLRSELSLLRSTTNPQPSKPASDSGGRDRFQPGRTFDRTSIATAPFGVSSWESNQSVSSSVSGFETKEVARIPSWQLQDSAVVSEPDLSSERLEEESQLPPLVNPVAAPTLSFAETAELVQRGLAVPGVQQVNDAPLDEPVEQTDPSPLKPWERAKGVAPTVTGT